MSGTHEFPERGRLHQDAQDRFVHDNIGKGHVAIEHVDPVTGERIKKIIHDPPHTTAEQIAALDHHNKKTGHERHAWKEEGIIPKEPPHEHHHVERIVTHTGSYMLEKEPTEEELKILEEQKRRELEHEKQHVGMEGESPQLSGQQLRERIQRLVEETIDHVPAGPFVGTKQEPHPEHDIKNEHELGHGHRGPGEGDLPKHVHHGIGPSVGHTTKAEQHKEKSAREKQLALDMAEAERSRRKEHKQRQQERQQQLQEQYQKKEEEVTKYHLTDLEHFKKGEPIQDFTKVEPLKHLKEEI